VIRYTQFSGGQGSYRTAKLDRLAHPGCAQRLTFADVLYEDADTYRFLIEAACDVLERTVPEWLPRAEDFPDYQVGADVPIEEYRGDPDWRAFLANLRAKAAIDVPELIWLVEGRDPWEVYRDERFVGNSSADPCSKILKRQILDKWRKANCTPEDTFAVGIDAGEHHRLDGLAARMALQGWHFHSPLLDDDLGYRYPVIAHGPLEDLGVVPPALYALDYKHGNCGGMCCKAGLAHWANRRRVQPRRFHYDRMMERKVREYIGNPAATFLRDRRGGITKPLSLDAFDARLRASPELSYKYEPGSSGCGCALDDAI